MADIRLRVESNRACENDTADRFVQLWLAGQRSVVYDQIPMGRKDIDRATIGKAIENWYEDIGPELRIAGLAVVQLCHRKHHRVMPGNGQGDSFNVELRGAWLVQQSPIRVERELIEGSAELDGDGIGSADFMEVKGPTNTFDIGGAYPEQSPFPSYGIEAARPLRARRVIGLIRPMVTKVISPAVFEQSLGLGTDI